MESQPLTRDDVDHIVEKAVKETLTLMGVDTTDPIEMQKDFQALREWRNTTAQIRSKGLMTLVGIVTAGFLGVLWVGVQYVLSKP